MVQVLRGWSPRDLARLVGVIIALNALGGLPAVLFGADTGWIDRPWFFPPEALFPIAWTLLFTLQGIAVFIIWQAPVARYRIRRALGVFSFQFLLNLLWTPVFFGLQRPVLGVLVIGGLWVAIVATIVVFRRIEQRAGWLLVPYLLWVSFALVLNAAIAAG